MINTLITFALFWGIFLIITLTTHYLYNVRMWGPAPFSYLDVFPFKCYRCATTWSLIVAYLMVGIFIKNLPFIVLGVILAALYGYGLNKTEKERFDNGNNE